MGLGKRGQKKAIKKLAKSIAGMGTPTEVVFDIFTEVSIRYRTEENIFFDDDSELKRVLEAALKVVAVHQGRFRDLSKPDKKTIEDTWNQLFNFMSEADLGYENLDDLLQELNAHTAQSSEDYESIDEAFFPDLATEVRSPSIRPERLAELATSNVDWFNEYEEFEVKNIIAQNSKTPESALEVLAESANYQIRMSVVSNISANLQTIKRLATDTEKIVREAASKRLT